MKLLERIQIKGFKSILDADIELSNLNVLIGANGSGKSNFITLFKLFNQIVEKNLQLYVAESGGVDSFLYYGQKTTSRIIITLFFGQNGYKCSLIPTTNDTLIFESEECWYHGFGYKEPYRIDLGEGHKETRLYKEARKQAKISIADHVLSNLSSWKVYHFHDTSDSAKVKQTGDIDDNDFFYPDASNLAAFLYLLQEKYYEHYTNIVDTIKMAAPFFKDFVLRPSPFNPNKIKLEWREKGSKNLFNAHSFSDGTLRFIALATLLLQPELPSTILLDEPELGLHPYAVALLANLLRSASMKTQVIVSTQSVTLVNQFDPEQIIVVDRDRKQSTFRHLRQEDMSSWLDDYGLGDLWEKNILGGRPQNG
jgi:predicted ATPase